MRRTLALLGVAFLTLLMGVQLTKASDEYNWMCVDLNTDFAQAVKCSSDEFAGVSCPEASCGETYASRRVFCRKGNAAVAGVEHCGISSMPSLTVKCPAVPSNCFKNLVGTRCNVDASGNIIPEYNNIACASDDAPEIDLYRTSTCVIEKKTLYPAPPSACGTDQDLRLKCRVQPCSHPVEYEWVKRPISECIEEKTRCASYAHAEVFCSTKNFYDWLPTGFDAIATDDSFCSHLERPPNYIECNHSNSNVKGCKNGGTCELTPAVEDGADLPVKVGSCRCALDYSGDYCEHQYGAQIASAFHNASEHSVYITYFSNSFHGTENLRGDLYAWKGTGNLPDDESKRIFLATVRAQDTYIKLGISAFGSFSGSISVGLNFGVSSSKVTVVLPNLCSDTTCSGHGICEAGACHCYDGFSGSSCEIDACANVECGVHGNCQAGVCECNDGYSGASCELCGSVKCSEHGTCSNSKCVCDTGFIGADCSSHVCDSADCGEHGSCNIADNGKCACIDGFTGEKCDIAPVSDPCDGFTCAYPKQICLSTSGSAKCECPMSNDGERLFIDHKCEVPIACVEMCPAGSGHITGEYNDDNELECNCGCLGYLVAPACKECGLKNQCKNGGVPNRKCTGCECSSTRHGMDCSCRLVNIRVALSASASGKALDTKAILRALESDVRVAANSTTAVVAQGKISKAIKNSEGTFYTLAFKIGAGCVSKPFVLLADDNILDRSNVYSLVDTFITSINSGATESLTALRHVDKTKGVGVTDDNCEGSDCPEDDGDGGKFEGSDSSNSNRMTDSTKLALGLGIGLGALVIIAIIVLVCLLAKKETNTGNDGVELGTRNE